MSGPPDTREQARATAHGMLRDVCLFGFLPHSLTCDRLTDYILARDAELPDPPGDAGRGEVRSSVRVFSLLMEDKLRQNDHKGGWQGCTAEYLKKRLLDEAMELVDAVDTTGFYIPGAMLGMDDIKRLGREAADVANFAMMIADNCGALVERNTRPAAAPETRDMKTREGT